MLFFTWTPFLTHILFLTWIALVNCAFVGIKSKIGTHGIMGKRRKSTKEIKTPRTEHKECIANTEYRGGQNSQHLGKSG